MRTGPDGRYSLRAPVGAANTLLLGIAPASAKVAVLIVNIFVASIAFWCFYKAGHFDRKIFLSFAAASIPLALDEARRAGRIKAGEISLLLAFGAGLTYGSALIRW